MVSKVSYQKPLWMSMSLPSETALYMAESYTGASRSRRSMSDWYPSNGDADTDITVDLPLLRVRSRDMVRNNPLACGAINTKVTSIIGTGLKLQSRIDHSLLNMSEEDATAWQKNTEHEFSIFSKHCDIERTLDFLSMQEIAFRSVLENGDVFALLPVLKKARPETPYQLKIQLIEADRVGTPLDKSGNKKISNGIKRDETGAIFSCFVADKHPGAYLSSTVEHKEIYFFGKKTGRRNILHLFHKKRVGQSRGVPDLAGVIEPLKQLDRYTEAEIMAAVVSSMFTVFVKTEDGEGGDIGNKDVNEPTNLKMQSGAVVGLADGEDISIANPGRPNPSFDPFVQAILRQVGVSLELPFEILVKHFTRSYSAARASMLEAWRYYLGRRAWMAKNFCNPVYEVFMDEAVATGRIHAPGYFENHSMRHAYLNAVWIGPPKGQIDELREVSASEKRINVGTSSLTKETAEYSGEDWEDVFRQQTKEKKMREGAGFISPVDTTQDNIQTPPDGTQAEDGNGRAYEFYRETGWLLVEK